MQQGKKYNLRQMLADIEEDIASQKKDVTQQIDISQQVITALLFKKKHQKTHNPNSRNT